MKFVVSDGTSTEKEEKTEHRDESNRFNDGDDRPDNRVNDVERQVKARP